MPAVFLLGTGGRRRFLQTYYNEEEVRDICRGLIESVRYCHELGIVHRDLRPENLVLSSKGEDASLKLTGFGFACSVLHGNVTAKCGSPGYVSPEVLRGLPYGTVGSDKSHMRSERDLERILIMSL